MFPVSAAESVSLPVTDNETGNFYQPIWHYHYYNQLQSPYVTFGNVLGTSGLFVNNSFQPHPYSHQFIAAYPGFDTMRLPQGISHENNPLDQRVVLSCVTPEHDEPTFQIKSEVEGDIAVQDGNNVCETPNADSSYEDHLKIETGYSNLQGNEVKFGLERFTTMCSFCGRTFSDIEALQDHLPTHNDLNVSENKIIIERKVYQGETDKVRPFVCKMCLFKFPCATDLRIHLFVHSGKSPTCEVCKRVFPSRSGLRKHMQIHKAIDAIPFKEAKRPISSELERKATVCSFCNKSFSSIDALQDHLTTHNDTINVENDIIPEKRHDVSAGKGSLFVCSMCPCKFTRATDFRIHLFLHSGKTPTCEVCSRTFLLRKRLQKHMIAHEKIRNFKCNICEKVFHRNYILQNHIAMSHGEKTLQCNECNSVFRHSKQLTEHKRWVHSSADDLKCAKCGEQCNSLKDLSKHKLTHLKASQFMCFICNKVFVRKKDLTHHKATYHGEKKEVLYQCNECDKKFKLLNNLIDHKKLHADDETCPKLRCGKCSKVFANEKYLKLHTSRCQGNDKLQLCHNCGQFYNIQTFKHHLNSHSGTNSYECEMCNEILPNRQSFKIHNLRHKGITPPTCDKCGLECVSASALKKHIDAHNGVKAFECKLSGQRYSAESSLKDHMTKHTGSRPHQCKLCQKSFRSRRNRMRHEKLHAKGFQRIRK